MDINITLNPSRRLLITEIPNSKPKNLRKSVWFKKSYLFRALLKLDRRLENVWSTAHTSAGFLQLPSQQSYAKSSLFYPLPLSNFSTSTPHSLLSLSLLQTLVCLLLGELAACVPPPLDRSSSTRQASMPHRYYVSFGNSRISQYSIYCFPSTVLVSFYSKTAELFPPLFFSYAYNLSSFKWQVNHHRKNGCHIFF